jgi:ADP-ribose pyrophosphatase YjhB (NUDIX family)
LTIQAYNLKVIVSGSVYEFYRFEEPIFRGYESKRGSGPIPNFEGYDVDFDTGEILVKDTKLESRARSNIRARNNIRRLALSNFSNKSKFITLTYRENVQDLERANKDFKAFVRKLKKEQEDFKYLTVIEFQERGAIHYHMICNLKYMRVEKIRKYWRDIVGEGNIDLQNIRHVDNIGAYIVKYMTKADADERLINKKMYQCSRNLERPKEFIGAQAEYLYKKILEEKRKKVYENSYKVPQTENKITYEEYNLLRS